MKIYTEECTCEVCGGPGLSKMGDWTWGGLRHVDPAICAEYLTRRRKALEAREKAVKEAEARFGAQGG